MSTQEQTDALMWASFLDAAETQPQQLVNLTAEHAAKLTCLRCGGSDFQTPGVKGWGISCEACEESMSISASGEEGGKPRYKKAFKCFFCRGTIKPEVPYVKMPDPRGGINTYTGYQKLVYLHGDGSSCIGRVRANDANDVCSRCNASGPQIDLFDMMGVGNADHIFCGPCKYTHRAGVLSEAQTYIEKERIKREHGGNNETPQKPGKHARTDADAESS